ncbi:SLC13 family permease [Thermococcus sp.]|uniref:SLC13 family permease n=1 Tax=Thermococcus sp. TaxID=35749 RepID=UPI0026076073|nr:SLC13 family permease [Thermococcus sp.]
MFLSFIDPSLPSKSLRLIDYESLATIISLLVVSRGLEISGAFTRIAPRIVELSGGSEVKLLALIMLTVAISSAVIMNDTAMFIFIPLVLTISRITKTDRVRTVTLTAIAANIGSALTPIGNPQNIIIWRTYGISVYEFISGMLLYVSIWIGLLLLFVCLTCKGKSVKSFVIPRVRVNRVLLFISTILLIVDVILTQFGYAFIGLALTLVILALIGREALLSLDVALVAIFALIFIDFRELSFIIAPLNFMSLQRNPIMTVALSVGLSQIISNVPATVLLTSSNVKPEWIPLAVGVNLGGTGIIIGSLANFIAVRISGISLKEFHKYSLLYFLVALGITILLVGL